MRMLVGWLKLLMQVETKYYVLTWIERGDFWLKEWACIQIPHHKDIPKNIKDLQEMGWRLHTYQATGFGTDVKHYLLFEKGE
jgi:hypothetical protein